MPSSVSRLAIICNTVSSLLCICRRTSQIRWNTNISYSSYVDEYGCDQYALCHRLSGCKLIAFAVLNAPERTSWSFTGYSTLVFFGEWAARQGNSNPGRRYVSKGSFRKQEKNVVRKCSFTTGCSRLADHDNVGVFPFLSHALHHLRHLYATY